MLELLLELAELLALALPFELALPDWAEASDVEASRSDKATETNRIIIYLHRSGTLLLSPSCLRGSRKRRTVGENYGDSAFNRPMRHAIAIGCTSP